jgi:hypothetical protein
MFEACSFNRDIGKLDALKASMAKHGYIPAHPLHVIRGTNGKLQIKAGHHRFEAAKSLGIGVYYIICDDEASIFELEGVGNPKWSFRDFFKAYLRTDRAAYLDLREFSERTGVNLKQSASMLAGESASSGNQNRRVKNGTYEIADRTHAEAVGKVIIACTNLGVKFSTSANFVSAVCSIMHLPEFDQDTFVRRVKENVSMMRKQATMAQYQELIEAVYNYRSQYKAPLAFMAREAARDRAAVKKPSPKE